MKRGVLEALMVKETFQISRQSGVSPMTPLKVERTSRITCIE